MKKAAPLLAILLVASAPFVRPNAQTATISTTQVSRPQPADAAAKPQPYGFAYAHAGNISTWVSSAAAR